MDMDRAQTLRLLMKQQQIQKGSSSNRSTVSAKDMVKELKKQKQHTPATTTTPHTAKYTSTQSKEKEKHPNKPTIPPSSSGGIPVDFFDSKPPPSAPPAETKSNNNLPAGFFDDPLADLTARGVDLNELAKKQDVQARVEVEQFLQSVEAEADSAAIGAFYDDDNVNEEEVNIFNPSTKDVVDDDQAVQYAYLAQLATLLRQSETQQQQQKEEGEEMKQLVEESRALQSSLMVTSTSTSEQSLGVSSGRSLKDSLLLSMGRKRKHLHKRLVDNKSFTAEESVEDDSNASAKRVRKESVHEEDVEPSYSPLDFF
eukprot:gene6846-7566_t